MLGKRRATHAFITVVLAASGIVASTTPASAATTYNQPVWFTWETATLDALIVPPAHGQVFNGNGVLGGSSGGVNEVNPLTTSYLRATEASANAWKTAIATYGASWLQSGLTINIYVVGRDNIPTSALLDPEIVVTAGENKGPILGVAVSSRPCIINNSKFFITSFTYEDMYSVSGHEFGHCLGLDHTYGSPDDSVITHDIIYATYNDQVGLAGNHKHCVSNLNVKGLERVFGGLFGQPSGGTATMASTSYTRISC